MRRGEIRTIGSRVTGREYHALVIGNDALNESSSTPWVMVVPLDTSGAAPDLLVTARVNRPVVGVLRLDNVTSVRKDRVGALDGRVEPAVMEAAITALRAALDLP